MSKEYFPHDYGARLSLRGVRKDFGLEGLGFYWCFVEILHEEDGYVKESDIENIAYDLQAKPEMCEAIIKNYDLFIIKKGKIYSERVLKNIKKRAEISELRKTAANERWKNKDDTQESGSGNGEEKKPKESVKVEKHKYGSFKNVLLTDEEYQKLLNEDDGDEAIEHLSKYIEMKGYKAKSHYLAIKEWVFDALKERSLKAAELQKQQERLSGSSKQKESPIEQINRVLGGG